MLSPAQGEGSPVFAFRSWFCFRSLRNLLVSTDDRFFVSPLQRGAFSVFACFSVVRPFFLGPVFNWSRKGFRRLWSCARTVEVCLLSKWLVAPGFFRNGSLFQVVIIFLLWPVMTFSLSYSFPSQGREGSSPFFAPSNCGGLFFPTFFLLIARLLSLTSIRFSCGRY